MGKKCKAYVQSTGKCKIKVPTRYNDYCEKDDCPLRYENKSKHIQKKIKEVTGA